LWDEVVESNPHTRWQNKVKQCFGLIQDKLMKLEKRIDRPGKSVSPQISKNLERQLQEKILLIDSFQTTVESLQLTVSNLTNRLEVLEGSSRSVVSNRSRETNPRVQPPSARPEARPEISLKETQEDPILAELLGDRVEKPAEDEPKKRPSMTAQTSTELLDQLDGPETLELRLQQKRKRVSLDDSSRKKARPNSPPAPRTNPRDNRQPSPAPVAPEEPAEPQQTASTPLHLTQNSDDENADLFQQMIVFANTGAFHLHYIDLCREITTLVREEKYKEAIAKYKPLVEAASMLDAESADFDFKKWLATQYINCAIAYGKMKLYQEAIELAQKARLLHPTWYKTYSTEASILYKDGNYQASETSFKKGIEVCEGNGRQKLIQKFKGIRDTLARKRKESIISSPGGRDFRTPTTPAPKRLPKKSKVSPEEKKGKLISLSPQSSRQRVAHWTVDKLKKCLRHNDQKVGGKKEELVARLVDCITNGSIPRCPNCAKVDRKTFLRKKNGMWLCPGGFDISTRQKIDCDFYEAEVERSNFYMPPD